MPYNKGNLYATSYIHVNNSTSDPCVDHQRPSSPVWIPSLNLTGLTCDDENEKDECREGTKDKHGCDREGEGVLFVRKQRPSFVFPSESTLINLNIIKNNSFQNRNEEDTKIISLSSNRNSRTNGQPLADNRPIMAANQNHVDENTISFSLSEPNIERYLTFDPRYVGEHGHVDRLENDNPTDVDLKKLQEQQKSEDDRPTQSRERTRKPKPGKSGESLEISQEVIDVIVVNGNLKSDDDENDRYDEQIDDAPIHEVYDENNAESDKSKEKSKLRVTFSFDQNLTPHGSIKRYTPIKGDANFRPQGVLKKRPATSQVSSHPSSSEDNYKHERSTESKVHNDGVPVSSSSYQLENHRVELGLERGIPVKYIHTTDADLEKKQNRMSAMNIAQKPPVPSSTRITLSMAAEKAGIVGGTNRRMLSRSHNYSSAHTRGRMAYFRPADGGRQPSSPSIRSKSAEDVSYSEPKSRLRSESPSKPPRSRANLPFTLRRCASSDHELIMSNKQKPAKPKIAFGTFILPKEPVCQVRNAQIQIPNVDSKSSPQGGYVHTHTRRSPYAAPTQLFLKENQKPDISRRPVTAQTRSLSQPATPAAKDLSQRHSAPSSYGSTREKSFHNSQSVRLSINTSPSRVQGVNKSHVPMKSSAAAMPHNVPREAFLMRNTMNSGAHISRVRKTEDFDQHNNRPNIAAMNMISKRDKGASHHRFVSKLRDYCKEVS